MGKRATNPHPLHPTHNNKNRKWPEASFSEAVQETDQQRLRVTTKSLLYTKASDS